MALEVHGERLRPGGEPGERVLDLADAGERVQPLRAGADLAGRLRSTEQQNPEHGELVGFEVERLVHDVAVLRDAPPVRRVDDASVYSLIGDDSPMQQHMTGRLTAATVDAGGKTQLEAPHPGEDLFLYVTDGTGQAAYHGEGVALGQYDVILATPEVGLAEIQASADERLHFLSFYLPKFL